MVTVGQFPFGGIPGTAAPLLSPGPVPTRVYRVIPGAIWWRIIYWNWRLFKAARAAGRVAPRPTLAPPGVPGVYVTDRDSLQYMLHPDDFAHRVGLSQAAQTECNRFGCAIVEFGVPNPANNVAIPSPFPGTVQGMTVGGAREWVVNLPVELDDQMRVWYVERIIGTSRHFELPL